MSNIISRIDDKQKARIIGATQEIDFSKALQQLIQKVFPNGKTSYNGDKCSIEIGDDKLIDFITDVAIEKIENEHDLLIKSIIIATENILVKAQTKIAEEKIKEQLPKS